MLLPLFCRAMIWMCEKDVATPGMDKEGGCSFLRGPWPERLRAAASLASIAALMADSGAPSVGRLASSSRLPLTHVCKSATCGELVEQGRRTDRPRILRAAASLASIAALMADSGAPSVGRLASSSRLPLMHVCRSATCGEVVEQGRRTDRPGCYAQLPRWPPLQR